MASFLFGLGAAITETVSQLVTGGAATEESIVGFSLDQNEGHRPTQEDECVAMLNFPASLPAPPPASTSTEGMAAPLWRRSTYQSYLAVYDGHGGSTASGICREKMAEILSGLLPPPTMGDAGGSGGGGAKSATNITNLSSTTPSSYELMSTSSTTSTTTTEVDDAVESGTSVSSSIVECYQKTDELLNNVDPDCGTTVAQCLLRIEGGDAVLYASNVGDSRCILVRSKGKIATGGDRFVRLTVDHRCSNEAEVARIKAADGFVFRNRVSGTLAVTRALGHRNDKDLILSLPEVKRIVLGADDLAVVVATDGIWDNMKEEDVAANVEKMRGEGKSPREAAQELKNQAMSKYGRDNIGVVVLYL
ncbi:hypothetical protein TrLO_g7921 [Triparma laevis f. longispina]|uniref:PPM-type phosphatase domain-containing protein n=1 Tax=Triparma laevis f. longispina TaxID=1714387 RepID=A0A9W7FSR5_9STRA|nr:hypothetical protein TrLO_g7921 [Triparma laevis f. longispina]